MADPFSAWGPEDSGERLYEKDQIARRKSALDAQYRLGEIAMQPDEARLKRSHADLYEAHAGRYKRENAAAQRLEEAVSGAQLPDDPMEKLYKLSDLAAKSGDIKRSSDMLTAAGQLALRGAQAERAMAAAENQQVQAAVKQQDFIANRLSATKSQGEFNAANQLFEQAFGEPSPYKGQTWTPALAQSIGEGATSAKDRLNAKLRENEERGRAAGRGIMDRHNRATEANAREANRIREDRNKALVKVGGTAGTPSPRELDRADSLVKEQLPDMPSEDRKRAGPDIASRAKEIRAGNRAIGMSQALTMAFKEMQEGGAFAEDEGLFGSGKFKKQRYSSGGMSRSTALAAPEMTRGGVKGFDPEKAQKNRWYVTPAGPRFYLGANQWRDTKEAEDDDEDE